MCLDTSGLPSVSLLAPSMAPLWLSLKHWKTGLIIELSPKILAFVSATPLQLRDHLLASVGYASGRVAMQSYK